MAYQVQSASFNAQEAASHLRAAEGALRVGDLCGLSIWKREAETRALLLPEPARSSMLARIGRLPEPHPAIADVSCMSRFAFGGLGSNGTSPAAIPPSWAPRIDTTNTYQMVGLVAFAGILGLLLFAGRKEHAPRDLTRGEAKRIGRGIGIDWATAPFSVEDLRRGIEVEMEHGPGGPAGYEGDVTSGDLEMTARIALAHLAEHPRYYDYLEAAEARAEAGLEPNARRKAVKLSKGQQLARERALLYIDDAEAALKFGDVDAAADILGPFNRATFMLPPKARKPLRDAMFALPWPHKGRIRNADSWLAAPGGSGARPPGGVAQNMGGAAADAAWLVHESDITLAEAADCWQAGDVDCAQTKGQEARELARTALVASHRAWPWQRGGAARAAQRQYDEAHDFLWETFWAQRRTA